jgi:ATP-dependent protease ClpP protease subunit
MQKSIHALIALIAALIFGGAVATASELNVDTGRLIRIEGVVDENILAKTGELNELVTASTAPVYILINSPGGEVLTGLQFVNAIKDAQARGVSVKCFVPNLAMSMAFVIFSECSERYAQRYSLLLFHPMRVTLRGNYRADDLTEFASGLNLIEAPLINTMVRRTGLKRDFFLRNYFAETVWTAETLKAYSPNFVRIVDSFGDVRPSLPK